MLAYAGRRLERLFRRHLLGQHFVIKRIHSHRLFLDLHDEGISRHLLHCRDRERDTLYILRQVLQPGMTVLDVGANIGYYVLLELDLIGRQGFIHAVEPIPDNVELLRRNLAANGFDDVVRIEMVGISDRIGRETMYLSERHRNLHTFCPVDDKPADDVSPRTDAPTMEVGVTTLAEFARGKGRIDFVRMDIEGYEIEAIQGMQLGVEEGWLRPTLLFEVHPIKYREPAHSMRSCLDWLFRNGYRTSMLSSTDHRRTGPVFAGLGYSPERTLWTDGDLRAIYRDIDARHAATLVCEAEAVRSIVLAPPAAN